MQRRSPRVPSYRLHKASGLAVVTLDGRDVYLGKHNMPDSVAAYHKLIAEWQLRRASGMPTPRASCTINEIFVEYWKFCLVQYRKSGQVTGEVNEIWSAMRELLALYGDRGVNTFGPLNLKTVRQAMIERGHSRGVINQRVGRIKRMFKWGVEHDLVRPQTLQALQAVARLRKGRTDAREADPVEPADERIVEGVLKVCLRQVAAMIRLQIATPRPVWTT